MQLKKFFFLLFLLISLSYSLIPLKTTYDLVNFQLGEREVFNVTIFETEFDEDIYINGSKLINLNQTFSNDYPNLVPENSLCLGPIPTCLLSSGFCQTYSKAMNMLLGRKKERDKKKFKL